VKTRKASSERNSDLWESGKTSSERESKIFSPSLENEGAPQTVFNEAGLEMVEKRFLSGEERVFSRLVTFHETRTRNTDTKQ
jgi:hypothetical protein